MGITLNFDARTVQPSSGAMDAIPAGWYNALIDESEMKPTKDGSGSYIELRFSVIDGQYAGRKVFSRLNVRNSNHMAQEIAYKDLSAICYATGVLQVQDSSQLHGIPIKIKVKLRKATEEYEASNDIGAYKNINEQVGEVAPAAPPFGFPPQQPQFQAPAQQQFQAPAQQQFQAPAQQQFQPPAQQQFQPPAQQQFQAGIPPTAGMPAWALAQPQSQAPAAATTQSQPEFGGGFPGATPPWVTQPVS